MKAIQNWDNIQESGSFQRLKPGGYLIKILNVQDFPEKQYLKISFDISDGAEKGFFKKQFDSDTRAEKKWPNAGSFVRSYKETAAGMFKGFIGAVERSNKNFTWNWDEKSLVGKIVGIVAAEEQYQNQKGQVRDRTYVASVRSVDVIKSGEFEVPEKKMLDASKVTTAVSAPFANPFADDSAASVNPFENEPAPAASSDDVNPWDDSDDNPFI